MGFGESSSARLRDTKKKRLLFNAGKMGIGIMRPRTGDRTVDIQAVDVAFALPLSEHPLAMQ